MYLNNTTFVVENSHVAAFERWAKEVYVEAARKSGRFSDITISRILTQVSPDSTNYAILMRCHSLDDARQWHDDVATILRDDLSARIGRQNVLFFMTEMEEL